jgi:hypothetical protein
MAGGARVTVYRGQHVTVDFQPDWPGIARCAQGPELKEACTSIAEHRAKPYAIRISPRSNDNRPGHQHYQDSFVVKTGTTVINEMRRVAARLWNMSDHAVIVEFGNGAVPAYRVLGRTLNYLNGPIAGVLQSEVLDAYRENRRRAGRASAEAGKD